jgi:hypothetical protein
MPRPRKLSKTKQLRRHLRQAIADHKFCYDALNRTCCEHMAEVLRLRSRLNAYGCCTVDSNLAKQFYTVSMRLNRTLVGTLQNPGELLADLAEKLCTQLVREVPELSGTLPHEFFTKIRNLPSNERRAHLIPLWDCLRHDIFNAHVAYDAKDNADIQELNQVFTYGLTFPSFCHLLTLLEKHANCLPAKE